MILSVAIFLLGSDVCGGANDKNMLILGRAIQGLGNGAINAYVDMIICDLVPLKERSKYMGLIFAIISCSTTVDPFVGGLLAQHST